jgi:hypothetical protein
MQALFQLLKKGQDLRFDAHWRNLAERAIASQPLRPMAKRPCGLGWVRGKIRRER